MTDLMQDIRDGMRTLRGARGLAITVVVILGLGIGGTTGTFAVVDRLVLRSLPIAAPEELVQVTASALPPFGGSMGRGGELSYPAYVALREGNDRLELCAAARVSVHVSFGEQAERVSAEIVSGSYFTTIGVGAAAGRTITADDDREGAPAVAMVSYTYWTQRLGGDAAALGRTILINSRPATVIGVVSAGIRRARYR